ncbi:MAG: zinc-ribbon domain-containing protein [Acetivibrio sp.]
MSIFDIIGNSVNEAGSNLSQKAKELTEQTRLNSEISKNEKIKIDYFKMLGEMKYMELKENRSPDYSQIFQDIDETVEQIKKLKEELSRQKKPLCKTCGKVLDEDAKFCAFCGAKTEDQE